MPMAQTVNPYYPYSKTQDFTTMPNAETFLKKLVDYLLDLPMKGYTPPSDTSTPRSRLIRLLYYDVTHPMDQPLPTPKQKLEIVYDPESPDVPPDKDKGYRLYPMIYPVQAESMGKTTIRIFMGYAKPRDDNRVEQTVEFRVLSNTSYENNENGTSLSRTYQICLEIIRCLHGVNIDGIGGMYFNSRIHPECGLEPIADQSQNVGYRLVMGLTYMGTDTGDTACSC